MAVTADKPAPYAPAKPILEIIQRYRQRGLVFPVTPEVLGRAGTPESLIPRTMQALQTLDLFKESGNPTETLEGLRLAPEAEFKQRLGDWLKAAYADVFAFVDPATDDEVRIRDAFRNYQPIGQQPRMVTLFQGLCSAAGLIPEKARTPRAPAPPRATRPYAAPVRPNNGAKTPASKTVHTKPATGLPPALLGLLESLPADGWTEAERKKFIEAFGYVLDFVIPIVKDPPKTQNGGQS
jgi:Family of unknown function (DUF5343)